MIDAAVKRALNARSTSSQNRSRSLNILGAHAIHPAAKPLSP